MKEDFPEKLKMPRKKQILLYMADRKWHTAWEMVQKFGWSWNQRKNIDLAAKGGIEFESRMVNGNPSVWEYRLVTPNDEIDFENCCRIPKKYNVRIEENGQIAFI